MIALLDISDILHSYIYIANSHFTKIAALAGALVKGFNTA